MFVIKIEIFIKCMAYNILILCASLMDNTNLMTQLLEATVKYSGAKFVEKNKTIETIKEKPNLLCRLKKILCDMQVDDNINNVSAHGINMICTVSENSSNKISLVLKRVDSGKEFKVESIFHAKEDDGNNTTTYHTIINNVLRLFCELNTNMAIDNSYWECAFSIEMQYTNYMIHMHKSDKTIDRIDYALTTGGLQQYTIHFANVDDDGGCYSGPNCNDIYMYNSDNGLFEANIPFETLSVVSHVSPSILHHTLFAHVHTFYNDNRKCDLSDLIEKYKLDDASKYDLINKTILDQAPNTYGAIWRYMGFGSIGIENIIAYDKYIKYCKKMYKEDTKWADKQFMCIWWLYEHVVDYIEHKKKYVNVVRQLETRR